MEEDDEQHSVTEINSEEMDVLQSKSHSRKSKKKKNKTEKANQKEAIVEEPMTEEREVYIPGRSRPLDEDEELVMDKSAYRLFYQLQVESSSLSFDVLLDNLGSDRQVEVDGAPACACLVAGTQAVRTAQNKLVVMRLTNLRPMCKKEVEKKSDDESDSEDDSSSDEDLDSQPEIEAATVQHNGTVNRVRTHQFRGHYLAASWSENGKVYIWDLTRPLSAVHDSAVMTEYSRDNESPKPLFIFKGHSAEGYALDWSPFSAAFGHLVTGDCFGEIRHWTPRTSDWLVSPKPFTGHTSSVEDLQWSPTEATVFISASADRTIRVWDTRASGSKGNMLTVPEAHPSDVNVISWNKLNPVQLVSGGDEGHLKVWDLRLVHQHYGPNASSATGQAVGVPYTHLYQYHSSAITSVEWHPSDAGVFAASSEDDQVTLWDVTLEQEAETSTEESQGSGNAATQLPVQLLFAHTGQSEVKEVHWHPQLPGLLLSTGIDGFNVFRTCNV